MYNWLYLNKKENYYNLICITNKKKRRKNFFITPFCFILVWGIQGLFKKHLNSTEI